MLWATGASVLLSTLMGCYGWLMAPVGWAWTAASWGYALVWFFIFDAVKLLLYRLLDPDHTVMHGSRYLQRWLSLRRSLSA